MSGGLQNPQGWNRYSYVENDPVNYHDPAGLFRRKPDPPPEPVGPTPITPPHPSLPEDDPPGGVAGVPTTDVENVLDKDSCWKRMGAASAAEAKDKLKAAKIGLVDYGGVEVTERPPQEGLDPATAPKEYEFKWKNGYAQGDAITVNLNLFNSPAEQKWKVGNQSMSLLEIMEKSGYGNLTAGQYRTMVLLHELSHLLGRPDDQTSPTVTKAFDLGVIQDCLK
jgi:hypothetical protein